jgi:hypothetical protein
MNPSYNDLARLVLKICPNATFSEDEDGQLVIHTSFSQVGDNDQPLEDLDSE